MTEQDGPDADEAAFDDPSTAWVREALAEARVSGPVPPDVAARLDDTLASLQAERQRTTEQPPGDRPVVVPLRRRLAPALAAAAVVLVIGGVAVGQIVRDTSGSSGRTASAGSAADRGPGTPAASPEGLETAPLAAKGSARALPQLSVATFPQDAARVMRELTSPAADTPMAAGETPAVSGSTGDLDQRGVPKAAMTAPPVTTSGHVAAADAACPGPDVPGAVTLPATLDGTPVALVFRPPTDTAQQVEAWSCDGATRLAEVSVPH